ncbi:MAG: PKD domain-containing protein [Candidatus Thermoplasmatota archaeon]|nr:PKD domain-containing protein [Candidatus Thermoplasmatota archaeon]MBU1940460.1 PKD domain-containing protein [Candidatus Thermoplasmatota archaeon]
MLLSNAKKWDILLIALALFLLTTNSIAYTDHQHPLSSRSEQAPTFFPMTFLFGTITNYTSYDSIILAHANYIRGIHFQPFQTFTITDQPFIMLQPRLGRITPTNVFGFIRIHTGPIEFKHIKDTTNDVINLNGKITSFNRFINVNNLDISSLTYMRDQKQICLALQISNRIVNRGDITDITFGNESKIDFVEYTAALITDQRDYAIDYVNYQTSLSYFDDYGNQIIKNSTNHPVQKNLILYSFELENETETYETAASISIFIHIYPRIPIVVFFTVLVDDISDQPLSIIIFEYNDGMRGQPIDFSSLTSGGTPPYTYLWEFGDNTTATQQTPSHTYNTSGNYTVTVTVTDVTANTATDSVNITILPRKTRSYTYPESLSPPNFSLPHPFSSPVFTPLTKNYNDW